MHRVLLIPEVLLNIFCRCAPSSVGDYKSVDRDLAALARTCRAFKEPALDILWSELRDPAPLSLCLPEISRYEAVQYHDFPRDPMWIFTFSRQLERAEWDIFRSYAHRIWWIRDSGSATFDWESVRRTSVEFTPAEPLFPNIRSLHCTLTKKTIPLLLLPFPSLIRLEVRLSLELDPGALRDPLGTLADASPNIWGPESSLMCTKIVSDAIYSWSNLSRLVCPEICLDEGIFIHLSRMPGFTELSCTLSTGFLAHTIPSSPLTLTALNHLNLHAVSLVSISRLLSWARLPSVTNFTVTIKSCPVKKDLTSFMASLQIAGMGHTVQRFRLEQEIWCPLAITVRDPEPILDLDDLRPCMTFHNLLHMTIDMRWNVECSDNKLLALTSSWPRLEELAINTQWGWNSPGGITPDGLASLLQMCPSLNTIALAIDTRGYTELPDRKCREPSTLSYAHKFRLNVLDSVIEQESEDAIATFLSSVVPHVDFKFTAWDAWPPFRHPDAELYRLRWNGVYEKVNEALKKRWSAWTQKSL